LAKFHPGNLNFAEAPTDLHQLWQSFTRRFKLCQSSERLASALAKFHAAIQTLPKFPQTSTNFGKVHPGGIEKTFF